MEDDKPDVGFALGGNSDPGGELVRQIARELVAGAPAGWSELDAAFALTVAAETARVDYTIGEQQARSLVPGGALIAARRHRELSADSPEGAWWRLRVRVSKAGELQVDQDYGEVPFPDDQLLAPDAYRADLEAYPRDDLPVWLAAYLEHDGRQSRSAAVAATRSWQDRIDQVDGVLADDQLPALHATWARWAVLSAAFVALRSPWGPRVLPSLGWFESSRRSGSTLYLLPGGRAVLSGGVWESPQLKAVYRDGDDMPDFYAGAPNWVTDEVLNPRAGTGMMTFCYWWERGSWYRGGSPGAESFALAVPSVWSAERVAEKLATMTGDDQDPDRRAAASALVASAEAGVVTRATVENLFGNDADVDAAFHQLSLAGVALAMRDKITQDEAISLVVDYITSNGIDTTNYPLEELIADRLSVGWIVFVPVPRGVIMIGRSIFYVADDGVVEHSSSSTAPSVYERGFTERFRARVG